MTYTIQLDLWVDEEDVPAAEEEVKSWVEQIIEDQAGMSVDNIKLIDVND